MNRIVLTGRVTADPELKQSSNGTNYTRFSIAVKRQRDKDKTDFFNCVAFGELAEKVIVKYAKKGTMVGLDGAIEFTKDSGDSRIVYHSVNVDRFELLSPKSENNGETAKVENINNLQPATNVTEDDMPF